MVRPIERGFPSLYENLLVNALRLIVWDEFHRPKNYSDEQTCRQSVTVALMETGWFNTDSVRSPDFNGVAKQASIKINIAGQERQLTVYFLHDPKANQTCFQRITINELQ